VDQREFNALEQPKNVRAAAWSGTRRPGSPIPATALIARSVRDRTELFDERRAFLTIVDHEGVVFS
jgi:hypothetical protein